MKLSIALCTCDGLPFLKEQLESYLAQRRKPDELVICDDASSDGTPEVVRDFQRQAPFQVHTFFNPQRMGVAANFGKALGLCTGDVIFPSDQDDVWLPDKLAVMEEEFARHPEAGMVYGDLEIVDAQMRPMGCTALEALGLDRSRQTLAEAGKTFELLCAFNVVSGAAMGFRDKYRDLILPVGPGWIHDEWIAFMVSAVSRPRLMKRVMAKYRQHERQEIGLGPMGMIGQFHKARAMGRPYFERMVVRYSAARERLGESPFPLLEAGYMELLERKLEHARLRLSMREKGSARLGKVLGAWKRGDYSRFDYGWKSAMQDLFLP